MTNKYIKNNGNGNFRINTPFEINTYNAWSVETKIITGNTISDCVLVTTEETDASSAFNFSIETVDKHLKLTLSYDGTTKITSQSTNILDINNTYYIKLEFLGNEYNVKVSVLNDTSYVNYINIPSTTHLYSDSTYVKFIPTVDSKYFNGKLDINSTVLKGDNTEIFNGSTASSLGYANVGATITSGVVSNFNTNRYIKCNGFEFKDYTKLIMKITTSSDISTKQTLISNNNDLHIYIRNGNLYLNENTNSSITLAANTSYYIGYLCEKNGQEYIHSLYCLQNNSYAVTLLPDFNNNTTATLDMVIRPLILWNSVATVTNTNVGFNNTIYLGSNQTNYFNGTIDLNSTIISNNIVTYKLTKLGYVPYIGTKILTQQTETLSPTLTNLEKLIISAENVTHQAISNISVNFITSNLSYYQLDVNEPNCIYVLSGTTVNFKVNAAGYEETEDSVTVLTTSSHITTHTTTLANLVTLTLYANVLTNPNDGSSAKTDITSEANFAYSTTSTTKYINNNTIQVKSGSTITYTITDNKYKTKTGAITMSTVDETVTETLDYYTYTVNSTTSGATVTLTAGDTTKTAINSATIKVKNNTNVTWTLSKTGYTSKSGSKRITTDVTESKSLALSTCTLTIRPTPSSATVTIKNASTGTTIKTGTGNTTASIDYGTNVSYTVALNGCNTSTGSIASITTNTDIPVTLTVTVMISVLPTDATVSGTTGSGGTRYYTANYGTSTTLTASRNYFSSQSLSVTASPGNSYSFNLPVNVSVSGTITETEIPIHTKRTLSLTLKGGGKIAKYGTGSYAVNVNMYGGIATATLEADANTTIKFVSIAGGNNNNQYGGGNGVAVYYNNNLVLVAPGAGGCYWSQIGQTTNYYCHGGGGYNSGAATSVTSPGTNYKLYPGATTVTSTYNKVAYPFYPATWTADCYGGTALRAVGETVYGYGGTGYKNTSYVTDVTFINGNQNTQTGNHGNNSIVITQV